MDPMLQTLLNFGALAAALGAGFALGNRPHHWSGPRAGGSWASSVGGEVSTSHTSLGAGLWLELTLGVLAIGGAFLTDWGTLLEAADLPWRFSDVGVSAAAAFIGYVLGALLGRR
jgi:hypothetical protein